MEWLFRILNPSSHCTQAAYEAWWRLTLQTTLVGFWGKFLCGCCIVAAIWFQVRRGLFQMALGFLCLGALIAFGGGLWYSLVH